MERELIFWLVLLVVLLVIELATLGLTTIWFAGGAAAAFVASILGAGLVVQIVVFLAVSILLLVFTRPFAAKYINKNRVRTNVDSLLGQKAVVTQDIDNLAGTGEARVDGKVWMARTENDGEQIVCGTTVTILGVSGVKLIVEK
ncbi:NfeD family protein [Hominisplanchenecus murintestinalis]|uniref:NfeD family protein n=1 Tax=Hominisplanchenecus murintestinalis TaxID=2941517 RepID=A0AC61R161_9FIRM|nr:NfeD family protein [Hominisplanchenecus murintestinalis]NBH98861.1 NfeD family protein [Lachnospiraceae bacterium]NBI76082.1 NfeD family protein [Lachnospiraceae bacterium]RKJ84850.1 NfeD family protein [Anaerotruncus sp. 1XD22-93]TGX99879.1 NfeD family protein [Hominisplanchenecus murintestinalis]